MSVFNDIQDQFLREHFTQIVLRNENPTLIQQIHELNILPSIQFNLKEEQVKKDIHDLIAEFSESNFLELSNDWKEEILNKTKEAFFSSYVPEEYESFLYQRIADFYKELNKKDTILD